MPPPRRHGSLTRTFTEFFSRLRNFVEEGGIEYPLHPKLYVDTDRASDRVIEYLEVKNLFTPSPGLVGCKFTYDDQNYFAITGVSDVDSISDPTYFSPVDLSAGLFVRLVVEMKVPISATTTPFDVYDHALAVGEEDDIEKPKPIKFDLVRNFFCDVNVFQIQQQPAFIDADSDKLLGYFIARGIKPFLAYTEPTLSEFRLSFESDNKHLPYDLLVLGFLTTNYKYAFVELYRCIERLYPLPALQELRANIPSLGQENPLTVAKILEDHLSWRPKEEASLSQLVGSLPQSITIVLESARDLIPEFRGFELSRFIYRLRNISVHYRAALGHADVTDEAWDILIFGLLQFINELYQVHKPELDI